MPLHAASSSARFCFRRVRRHKHSVFALGLRVWHSHLVTLVLGGRRRGHHNWSISLEIAKLLSNDVGTAFVTSLLQSQRWFRYRTLVCAVPWYWECQERLCGPGGGTNKNPRVNMRKASLACRQGGCRRHLRLGRPVISRGRAAGTYYFPARGTSGRLSAQLPLPIPFSASACEQAVSRELLLPFTRDTVLAAVPWLRFSPKARH